MLCTEEVEIWLNLLFQYATKRLIFWDKYYLPCGYYCVLVASDFIINFCIIKLNMGAAFICFPLIISGWSLFIKFSNSCCIIQWTSILVKQYVHLYFWKRVDCISVVGFFFWFEKKNYFCRADGNSQSIHRNSTNCYNEIKMVHPIIIDCLAKTWMAFHMSNCLQKRF